MHVGASLVRVVVIAFVLCAFASAFAPQSSVPANDGWITDQAELLSEAKERELEQLMESYRNGSGIDIAVLTVPSLGVRSIEDLALQTARAWKIGDAESSAGALLVIAQADRAMRIEVGRGLEGNVPDLIAGRIIREVIAPRFRGGDFEGGIEAGIRALHGAAGGDYGPLERAVPQGGGANPLAVMAIIGVFVFLSIRSRRRNPHRHGRMRGGGIPPVIIGGGRSYGGGSIGGGGFGGFGGGGGFSGGGASGGW